MKIHRYISICLILLLLVIVPATAQLKAYFHIKDSIAIPTFKNKPIVPDSALFENSTALYNFCKQKQLQATTMGYLEFSVDTVLFVGDTMVTVQVHIGSAYKWVHLSLDSIPPEVISKAGLKKLDWHDQNIQPKKLQGLYKKIIGYYENNGYPFAQIVHTHSVLQDHGIRTTLKVVPGLLVKIDTIVIKGDVDISHVFIQNYLGIKQGDVFNEYYIKQISAKIQELPFLEESAPWEMYQSIAKNELILHLKKKKSNQINGLVGLQPENSETGKMLLTVDALLDLKNSFGYGERIAASFQNLQRASPKLLLGLHVPYVMGLPIAIEANFNLYKRDTLFTRINFDGGVSYLFNSKDYFKVAYLDASYRVNYVDLPFIQREKRLPNIVDTRSNGVEFQLFFNKTDYTLAPRRGWIFNFNSNVLRRKVKENLQIATYEDGTGFDYATLYDRFREVKNQYKIFGHIDYYYALNKTFVLKGAYAGGWMQGDNLFMNELYQIGGFRILRGFDEESIFVNSYHIGTVELRMMMNTYSFFYIFSDYGLVTSDYNQIAQKQQPWSLGAGLNLQNDSGIFRIAVGVGKFDNEPFRLRQAKLHFGYTALF